VHPAGAWSRRGRFDDLKTIIVFNSKKEFSMKKTVLILLAVILGLSALAAAGFAGYHVGFTRGVMTTQDGNKPIFAPNHKFKPGK
jgi:hypothetical protein